MGTTLADCGQAERELLARLATPSRNRYYYGKLLDAYHLALEQRYGNDKRWLLNRLTLGTGVLCGLDVVASADGSRVRVRPGVAVDGVGREILVPEDSLPVDPRQPTDDCGRPDGPPVRGDDVVTLYICYHECEAEPAPVLVSECGPERGCENGLVRERYRLRVRRGEPAPPAQITPEQCAAIFGQPPDDMSRRAMLCRTVGGACDPPDETCVPLAIIQLGERGVASVDRCAGRRTIYSNAVLLDLILCLAARVDACCGQVRVRAIFAAAGNNQTGTVAQPLAQPLVARVVDGGSPVANEPVTFEVVPIPGPDGPGEGEIGDDPSALGPSVTVDTDANGLATLAVWRLGAAPGQQRVTARIASGTPSSVTFVARAARVSLDLPVVRAIWPPDAARLAPQAPDPAVAQWAREMARSPRVEVTFDRRMDAAQLAAPEPWLRVFVLHDRGPNEILVRRVALAHGGTAQQPVLGVTGITEVYGLRGLRPGDLKDARWLVLMRAEGGNIVDLGTPPQLLDAEFEGTRLSPPRLEEIWNLDDARTVAQDAWDGLVDTGAVLPQSGDGTAGGRFHSWFEVEGVGP
jgi:hypothetical protein